MKKELLSLGFTAKEIDVYLALIELGLQPASVVAKKTGYPKSTVLFFFEKLEKQGYIRKSRRGRVQYFYADPIDLQDAKKKQINKEQEALNTVLPLLKEFQSPYSAEPKVTFFEGVEGCKKAYSLILNSSTEVLEFGAHEDLVKKFGQEYMDEFIQTRVKNNIHLRAVCAESDINTNLHRKDNNQKRKMQLFPISKGVLYSSICIFEDKVLILNLYQDAYAILIQNKEVVDTLKTIFGLIWRE